MLAQRPEQKEQEVAAAATAKAGRTKPEEVTPLNKDDFEDF